MAPTSQVDTAESSLDLRLVELIADSGDQVAVSPAFVERRIKPRLKEPFPARIWGVDSGDLPFNVNCLLDNISSTGLYLRLPAFVEAGSEVRLTVHFLSGPSTGATAALRGRILRTEPQVDGNHGIAVAIERHRFL